MPRNILIDPQRTGTSNPNIQFSGSMANTIKLEVLTSGSVQFTGVSGSLLSVTDSLSGSLFAVSDVSGLPILETFSDDRVVMGRFNTNALVVTGSWVGIGTSSPGGRLDIFDVANSTRFVAAPGSSYIGHYANTHEFRSNTQVAAIIAQITPAGILPGYDVTYDLGSTIRQWRTIYATNISGSLTGSNVTAGQVVLAGTGGVLSGSNSFFWDNTNRRVGIGTSTSLVEALNVNGNIYMASSLDPRIYAANGVGVNIDGQALYLNRYANSNINMVSGGGNVGIGNTVGASITSRLLVTGSSTASAPTVIIREGVASPTGGVGVLNIQNSAGTSLLFVSGSGNVGVTPTTLTYRFQVDGSSVAFNAGASNRIILANAIYTDTNANSPKLSLFGDSSPAQPVSGPSLQAISTAAFGQHRLAIFQHGASDYTTETEVVSLLPNGNLGIGGTNPMSRFEVTGSGATSATSAANFVNSSGSSLLFVRNDGNIGIGTASPVRSLDVQNNTNYQFRVGLTSTFSYDVGRNTADGLLYFYGNQTGFTGYVFGGINGERVRIDSSGNVGIGTTIYNDKLAVNGTMSVTGSYLAPGVDNSTTLGTNTKRWSTVFAQNLSGSLTRLADGTSYLIAGSNVTITTGSSGAITIAASLAGGAVSGTGTTNYVTKWTSTTSVGNSVLYDDGANVGINTTSMTFRLEVSGSDARIHDVRIGRGAGSVVSNTAVGNGALNSNSTGVANTAIGRNSLNAVSVGNYNTAVGQNALVGATSSNNTAVGDGSAYSLTSNGNVTAVGQTALAWVTGGSNTAVGTESLHGNSSSPGAAANNTAVGYRAGYSITTGTNNAFLGYQAGQTLTTGANNVILGSGALTVAAADSNSIVIGSGSLGRGSNTTVIGNASTTLTLIPSGSLAMGGNATGTNSVSLGFNSTASSPYSTAIGYINTVSGQSSVAIGQAIGITREYSAGFGVNQTISGPQSITAGFNNLVSGGNSAAFGTFNTASGASTFVAGQFSLASGAQAVAIGQYVTGSANNAIAIGSGSLASGIASIAFGELNTSSTTNSVAIGKSNTSGGSSSTAIGRSNSSSGTDSVAIGAANISNNTSAAAIGTSNTSSGNTSFAAGFSNTASNFFSVALGAYNASSGFYSFAAGGTNTASGTSSVAMGQFSLASGAQSVAMGNASTGSFPGAIAIGSGSLASSTESIALGAKNTASGPNAVSIGNNSTASFTGSIAIGAFNTASGQSAAAIGGSNTASGGYGFAAGYNSTASGFGSIAMGGGGNVANIAFAMAFGSNNTASGVAAAAIGRYSLASGAQAIAIGSYVTGSNTSAVAMGASSVASGLNAVAIGTSNTASQQLSTALGGISNTASGVYSVAVGAYNLASGASSFVSGLQTTAYLNGQRSHSAGYFAAGGDAQISTLVARNSTTNASATELFLNAGATLRAVLPASTTWDADITVVARASTGTSHASFRRRCLISRNASNTTALVGSVQVVGSDIGSNVGSPPAGWAVTVSADDTNESLKIEVTGAVSTNIRWVARIELVEVGY